MSNKLIGILAVVISIAAPHQVAAHPGSGIVVDSQNNVFFQDSAARTIWKIDAKGKLTSHYDKMGGHWMALDGEGGFARSKLGLVERITPDGFAPALIVADGGAPITVNADGFLYYGASFSDNNDVIVGMMKVSPEGKQIKFAPEFGKAVETLGVTGLMSGEDGTVYAACLTRIVKVKADGSFSTVVDSVEVENCDRDAPTCFLRGLGIDSHGALYVAACGCRCVVKIASNGKIETFLKAERPWSPTGIAVRGDTVYVLEYTNANGHFTEGWLPRVRKVTPDGQVTVLATISEDQQNAQPNRLSVRR